MNDNFTNPQRLRSALEQAMDCLTAPEKEPILLSSDAQKLQLKNSHFHIVPEFFFQLSAATRFSIPGSHFTLAPGHMLLIPPRVSHGEAAIVNDGEVFSNLVLLANGTDLYCHLAAAENGDWPHILHAEHLQHERARSIGSWLLDASHPRKSQSSRIIRSLLTAALAETRELLDLPPEQLGTDPRLVLRCRHLIQNNLGNPEMTVAWLADELSCSADYLSHLFCTSTGTRLVDYINAVRTERAADLLSATRLSSKEIAWACGYANHSYFILRFRRQYGTSPLEWRAGAERL